MEEESVLFILLPVESLFTLSNGHNSCVLKSTWIENVAVSTRPRKSILPKHVAR